MSDQSIFSKFTIMIPPPRPDLEFSEERRELKEKIKEKGFIETIAEIVEDYYHWEDDPNPVSARRKKRAVLIFSRKELEAIIPFKIHKLIDDAHFLSENISKS